MGAELKKRPTDEAIRVRAYEIYVAEGCPEGRSAAHWAVAVAELTAPAGKKSKASRAAAAKAGNGGEKKKPVAKKTAEKTAKKKSAKSKK